MVNQRRGPWTQQEDLYLLQLVQRDGASNWVRISHSIGSRSPKQCRERFHQNLKPTLNHDPITPEEGEQIEKMVQEMGKRWAEIARRLKGRSDNAVKNWWNGGQNRRRRGADHRQSDSSDMHAYTLDHHHIDSSRRPSLPVLDTRSSSSSSTSSSAFPNPAYYAQPSQARYALPPATHFPSYPHPGQRPAPISIHAAQQSSRPGYAFDTPMPSPSVSVISGEGAPPSLVTDSGSESRSPHYSTSPNEIYTLPPSSSSSSSLAPRSQRRRSSILRYLPKSGAELGGDDDAVFKKLHLAPIAHHDVDSPPLAILTPAPAYHHQQHHHHQYQHQHHQQQQLLLPSPQHMVRGVPAEQQHFPQLPSPREMEKPVFRDPNYASCWSHTNTNTNTHTVTRTPPLPAVEPKKMALSSILA
ncbi:hypothetical protein EJ05DRAFT_290802 [Pseudovirgaria hyperparasitica]|uniref:Trichome differentiation protein GL1 n=1 Tax=Pseudovirgaria hyperparasitica TaxID=470096 RepID=A0A6A6WFF3_9PEZI|nr:uncharacterized protein EJ05DRAFT_290802 [Pseudovirgaria hyperparasitica]KAF2760616.1 hypothetical protein EJ05DRAFT_290802 [Pseudovirgaria hyperparasitica]